jgi:hypothetical protein
MNIYTGSFYTIGKTHSICQDYSFVQNNDVIVSDGCSSAMNSDVGSRVLTHSYIETKGSEAPWFNTMHRAYSIVNLLGLPSECLCATLLTLEKRFDNIHVNIWGDGCVVARHREDKTLEIFNLSFLSSAPYYLKYHSYEKEGYLYQFGDKAQINESYPFSFFERYPDGYIRLAYPADIYDLVAIFSDGISSFRTGSGEPVPVSTIAEEMLNFKGYAGNFVQRRAQRAFKVFSEHGWHNHDDFSIGVMKVSEANESQN